MVAFSFLASKRRIRENHTMLSLLVSAQNPDPKELKKQFDEWEKQL